MEMLLGTLAVMIGIVLASYGLTRIITESKKENAVFAGAVMFLAGLVVLIVNVVTIIKYLS